MKNQPEILITEETTDQIQIINRLTGQPIELPDAFKMDSTHGIRIFAQPIDWRCLVEKDKGYFVCNGEEKGSTLRLRILNYRLEEGVLFSDVYKEPETVVQAIFIDENDIVGTIVFRTISKDNFLQLVDNLAVKRIPLATQVITATMEKVSSKAGWVFHIVRFANETNQKENFEEIKTFVSEHSSALTCFRSLPRPE